MNYLPTVLTPRLLVVFLAILLVLMLLTATVLAHTHPGIVPTLAQSTDSILD